MIQLTIPGPPVGKARPRVTKNGTYTPKKTREYERRIEAAFKAKYHLAKPTTDPIVMTIVAKFAPPKGVNKRDRQAMLDGSIFPSKKPDADNILKIVCDALQGWAFEDDKQVIDARVLKEYDEEACVDIALYAPVEITEV